MIVIERLTKLYKDIPVLDDISLKVNDGEIIAITGPSGSGKSTLLRCICNLESYSAGTILIDNVQTTSIKNLASKVGMVFQSFNLFPHMTVLKNLTYAPVKVKGMKPEAAEHMAIELLRKVGLENKASSYPESLSGGQKQRAAIARTLVMQPEIILFDEPTSALDPENVREVLDVIRKLAHSGVTILIVTHELEFARGTADRILFFDHGKIIEQGSPAQILTNPTTERAKIFFNNLLHH